MESNKDTWVVNDGAVNPDEYSEQKLKVLWVLKETNGEEFNFLKFLENPKGYNRWKSTLGLVIKTSNAIFSEKDYRDYNKYPKDISKIMRKIAWINVKKTGGGPTSKEKELAEHAKKNAVMIENQIRDLSPDIIVLAGTRRFVSDKIKNDISSLTNKDTVVIHAHHTNQRKITHKEYITEILGQIEHLR